MLKVALIGLGGIAAVHICAYKRLEGVQIVAAADAMGEGARSYPLIKDTAVRLYSDAKDMLEHEDIDIVDICAPTHLHEELSVLALSLGRHVICEKPMASTSEGAYRIAEAARKSGKIFMTAQVIRFSKPYRYLAEVIRSGELGALVSLSIQRLSAVPAWRKESMKSDKNSNGGVIIDLSIHDIDFIYSALGEPETVSGVFREVSESSCDNYISAHLTYGNALVNLYGGFYTASIPFTSGFNAIFEGGYVTLRHGELVKNGEKINATDTEYPGECEGLNIDMSSAFVDEIGYFVSSVKRGEKTEEALPESTAASLALAEKIKAAAKKI